MTKSLKLLYLAVVMAVLVILLMGIYRSGGPEDIFKKSSGGKAFKPLAERAKRALLKVYLAPRQVKKPRLQL